MDDSGLTHGTQDESRPDPASPQRRGYEPPALVVIGPLEKITLGSGGSMNDGINKLKKNS